MTIKKWEGESMTVTVEEVALCLTELVHRSDLPERDIQERRNEVFETYELMLRSLENDSNTVL